MKVRLAIISPSRDAYSETFIQAHKSLKVDKLFFYYGGKIPHSLERVGRIKPTFKDRLKRTLRKANQKITDESVLLFEKSLKKNLVNSVLAEYGPTGAALTPICKKNKIPLFVHFHGYDASVYSVLEKHKDEYLEMFEYASVIFSVSQKMTTTLINLGCDRKKIIQNTYGPNTEFFKVEPQFKENSFITVGRFVDKKAPYYTLLAFKEVLTKFPEARLFMAGDGPLLNTIKNLANYFGLNESVEFLGVISREQFIQYLSVCTAYVQHSIKADNGDMEGTPVSIIEAAAAGVPVVSTFHAGIPEVVLNKYTGYLVDEHDVVSMAQYMLKLLENKDDVLEFGEKARVHIQSNFTLDQHLKRIEDSINHCI